MKNAILKNKNLNKLTKNEYDVYNALQKYRKMTTYSYLFPVIWLVIKVQIFTTK